MTRAAQISTGVGLLLLALIARGWFEATPTRHILVQYPLLVAAGFLLAAALAPLGTGSWNLGGVASLLAAIFAMGVWMLPRMVDASVTALPTDIAKTASLVALVGGGLRLGWWRAHPLLRAILKAQALSMLGILAFLYTHAPVRLCNIYLLDEQQLLGERFLILAFGLAVFWTMPLLGVADRPSRDATV